MQTTRNEPWIERAIGDHARVSAQLRRLTPTDCCRQLDTNALPLPVTCRCSLVGGMLMKPTLVCLAVKRRTAVPRPAPCATSSTDLFRTCQIIILCRLTTVRIHNSVALSPSLNAHLFYRSIDCWFPAGLPSRTQIVRANRL